MKHKHKAFSLAEVLITLGVIGVISAITMSLVIQNYQKQITVSKLKKAYTVLNQALKMSEIDNGSHEYWENTNELTGDELKLYLEKYWLPYLKVVKFCNSCAECGYGDKIIYKTANNIRVGSFECPQNSFVLADGTFVMINKSSSIYVDLNQAEKQNRLGRDVFLFLYSKDGVHPYGYDNNNPNAYCSKTSNNIYNGHYCGAKIMKDGWKIAPDYPW